MLTMSIVKFKKTDKPSVRKSWKLTEFPMYFDSSPHFIADVLSMEDDFPFIRESPDDREELEGDRDSGDM